MANTGHPDNRRERISEHQKAINLLKELKKREKGGRFVKVEVENGKPYYKFVKDGTDKQ